MINSLKRLEIKLLGRLRIKQREIGLTANETIILHYLEIETENYYE